MLTFIFLPDRTETTPSSTNPITSEVYDYTREDTHDERNEGKNYCILLDLVYIVCAKSAVCILFKNPNGGLWFLTLLSTIFQLYRDCQLYW